MSYVIDTSISQLSVPGDIRSQDIISHDAGDSHANNFNDYQGPSHTRARLIIKTAFPRYEDSYARPSYL